MTITSCWWTHWQIIYYIYCEAESLGKRKIGRSGDGGDGAEWEDEWQLLTSRKAAGLI